MHIVSMNDVPKTPRESALFTSKEVTVQPLVPEGGDYNMSIVNFGKGVRNKFHIHESDQILIVTEGKGIVATDQGQQEVVPGDVVFFPAGEKHWHGAAAGSDFSHIYFFRKGCQLTQLEE